VRERLLAAGALATGVPVAAVAADAGLLPRTFRRRFSAQVGLTPKRFARVQRLQRVVRGLDGLVRADWAAVAAEHGYADQPHLADEFRELAGVAPTEYLRSRISGPNHLHAAPGILSPGCGSTGHGPFRPIRHGQRRGGAGRADLSLARTFPVASRAPGVPLITGLAASRSPVMT
jgi:AraC-like DNA-binding protein